MLIAYLMMHSTFVSLFLNMRRLSLSLPPHSRSSGLWLAATALVSSCLAFMTALLGAWWIGMTIDPVLLGEALPFLVITVGFEKPFVLTRAVFRNPGIGPDGGSNQRAGRIGSTSPSVGRGSATRKNGTYVSPRKDPSSLQHYASFNRSFPSSPSFGQNLSPTSTLLRFSPPVPARTIVLEAVASSGLRIIRDYGIEIAVLVGGAMSGVEGLKQFCGLAALILTCDCLMLFGFYTAVLTIMVEVGCLLVVCA